MDEQAKELLEKFTNDCEEEHNKIYNENKPQRTIYHYTNFEALEKILSSRRLWFSDYKYLNDPTEIIYGQRIIKEHMLGIPCQSNNESMIRDRIVRYLNHIFDNLDKYYKFYVACFTTEFEKLALWRYYADNGSGVAIGFNPNFYQLSKSPLGNAATICKIIYNNDETSKILSRITDIYLKFQEKLCKLDIKNEEDFAAVIKALASKLISNFVALLPMFKDSSYKDEHEIRLFYTESLIDDQSTLKIDEKFRDYIPIKGERKQFVNLLHGNKPVVFPEEFCKSEISEIWIGPSCEVAEARSYVMRLLNELQYDIEKIKINKIDLPYRGI